MLKIYMMVTTIFSPHSTHNSTVGDSAISRIAGGLIKEAEVPACESLTNFQYSLQFQAEMLKAGLHFRMKVPPQFSSPSFMSMFEVEIATLDFFPGK